MVELPRHTYLLRVGFQSREALQVANPAGAIPFPMQTQTKQVSLPLQRHESGSHHPVVELVEWTPACPPPREAHSRSNWPRVPFLGPLTNRKINEYAREGRYGPQAQAFARAKLDKLQLARNGMIIRCECGAHAVGFMRYSYLPKSGYYCLVCREKYRSDANKDKELRKAFRLRVQQEYV